MGAALVFSGCKLVNNDAATVVSTVVVYNVSYQVLKKNPTLRPEFEKAREDLKAVGQAGEIDPVALLSILNRLSANENLKPVLTSAVILAQSYVSVPTTPEAQAKLKVIAGAVALGLQLALNDAK